MKWRGAPPSRAVEWADSYTRRAGVVKGHAIGKRQLLGDLHQRDGVQLEVVGLTKRFGGLTALDDVSLRVTPGSFHALLGENGAGKTTLVKCVVGYQRPDAGAVLVGRRERDIRSPADAHALGIGMVYQVSEDLDEILALSDRVVVMSGGRIVHATPIGAADIAVIGSAMAGHHPATLG